MRNKATRPVTNSRIAAVAATIISAVLAAAVVPAAAQSPSIKDFGEIRVDGPFTHKNLSIYVLFLRDEPGKRPDYITLSEGVRSGQVIVTEAKNASVGRLLITNKSAKHLFLQVGEVVHGGKQDRTLKVSMVVPPKSVDVPIPSFCVEQTRWRGGRDFGNRGLIVPAGVKAAIQGQSQGEVWGRVSAYKRRARSAISAAGGGGGAARTSSVNEELSNKHLRKLAGGYESALSGTIGRYKYPLGMVYAVNGQISTVDVYHSTGLFKKLFGALLAGAASDAAAASYRRTPTPPSLHQVANFIAGGWTGSRQSERLGLGNVYLRITGTSSRTGRLSFKDSVIHAQIVTRVMRPIPVPPRPIPIPRPPRPPRPWPRPR